jgi:hypothetical protein
MTARQIWREGDPGFLPDHLDHSWRVVRLACRPGPRPLADVLGALGDGNRHHLTAIVQRGLARITPDGRVSLR